MVRANRDLARQLLSAADLWLFVTTAARYADAVPWDLLRGASERGTSVAIVLDRVPPEAMDEIRTHLASMLREQGLASAPIFTVAETTLTADGLLSEHEIARLRSWLSSLARDAKARSIVVRRTLTGALTSLRAIAALALADATAEQDAATAALHQEVTTAYVAATKAVEHGMTDGTLLRGEVLARWQEFVGTGEFLRQVEAGISRLRDRITAAFKGTSPPASELGEALQSGVAELLTAQSRGASATVLRRWRQLPGGPELVAAHPDLASPAPESAAKVERLVRDWQGEVLDLVRGEGKDRRTTARVLSFGVNGVGVMLMLLVFSHTGGLTGGEVGIAGGSAVLAQRILEAIFGDQAVRDMAEQARRKLMAKAEELYAGEQARLHAAVAAVEVSAGQADSAQGRLHRCGGRAMSPLKMGPRRLREEVDEGSVPDLTALSAESVRARAAALTCGSGVRGRVPSCWRRRPGTGRHREGRCAHLDRRRTHRGRARGRHRQWQVKPVQRAGRSRCRQGRGPAADHGDTDRSGLGERVRIGAARLAQGRGTLHGGRKTPLGATGSGVDL